MIAYSYLRFSSPDQIKGDSLRRQLEKSEKYAVENDLTLDTTTRLQDLGLSAFDRSNVLKGELGGFLKAVEQGRIKTGSYLLVESLDRLSRAQVLDALQQFISIINAGIIIVTLADNQKYSKTSIGDNWSQLIISIAIMSRAHEESLMKSQRVGAAWTRKKQDLIKTGKLLTHKVPLWTKVVDGKIELIPERADVIRRMFEMSKNGIGLPTIVKTLNNDTPAWSNKGDWYQAYITKLMRNPSTYGSIIVDGVEVENYYPVVISKDEFLYNQKVKAGRRLNTTSGRRKGAVISNLFSGFIKCGYCGARMGIQSHDNTRGKKIMTRTLVCYGARTASTNCACIAYDYHELEYSFLSRITVLDLNTLFGSVDSQRLEELEQRMMELSAKIDDKKRKIANIYIAIEEDPLPGLTKRIKEIEAEVDIDDKKKTKILQEMSSEKVATSSMKERRASLKKLWAMQTKCDDQLALRTIRETIYEQIKSLVERIDVFPSGPSLNRAEREMRFFNVTLRSGSVIHISNETTEEVVERPEWLY